MYTTEYFSQQLVAAKVNYLQSCRQSQSVLSDKRDKATAALDAFVGAASEGGHTVVSLSVDDASKILSDAKSNCVAIAGPVLLADDAGVSICMYCFDPDESKDLFLLFHDSKGSYIEGTLTMESLDVVSHEVKGLDDFCDKLVTYTAKFQAPTSPPA